MSGAGPDGTPSDAGPGVRVSPDDEQLPSGGLVRTLSHRQTTMIGLGSALGTGLFLGSATAISIAGPAVILAYLAGAALITVVALALGEMTTVHPVRGAFGVITGKYLGAWAGFLTRWSFWAAAVVAIGGEVVAGAIYVRFWWPQVPLFVMIVVLAAAVVGVNLVSVKSFGNAEVWLSGIKITALVAFIVTAGLLVFVGLPSNPATGLDNLTAHGGFFPNGPGAVWLALPVVMFAFIGFETISISAAETADPTRSIRTAMRSMVWRLAVFYVLSIALVVTIFPWTGAVASDGSVRSSPFVQVFATVGVPAAASVTNAVVLIAALSAANANLYNSSRLLHSLGSDGLAPRSVARVNRRGVPVGALLWSASGLAVAAALSATGVGGIFNMLVALATFAVLIVWLLILLSYQVFRRQRRDLPRERGRLRLWGGAATGVAGLVGLLVVMATATVVPDMQLAGGVGLVFTVVLLVAYAAVRRYGRSTVDVTGNAEE